MTTRAASVWILAGLLLLALNLRPAAVSVGPVLKEIQGTLSMSGTTAGLLTSLPVVAFAIFGALAPTLARRVGLHRAILLALGVLITGLLLRPAVASIPWLLAFSALALAGMAVANVLLPSLVKLHFPERVGTVTALYSTALSIGTAGALVLTVPIAEAGGGWRVGLGAWGALAVVAALPWLTLVRHDRALGGGAGPRYRFLDVLRTPLGRAMTIFFGTQSIHAYTIFGWFPTMWRDAGYSANEAGLLVGLLAGVAIPCALVFPALVHRVRDPRPLMLGLVTLFPSGYLMMLLAPHALAVPAAVLIGGATTVFPVILVLIGMRARTPSGTAALSSVSQSAGYLLAGVGPIAIGALHDAVDSWTAPLIVLLVLLTPLFVLTFYLGRPLYLEDQLPDPEGAVDSR